MASLQPVGGQHATETAVEEETPPGVWLERGLFHFNAYENENASAAFQSAIASDRLNDAGRALAYWHIFVAEQRMGRIDNSSNALASFVVVAEDIIDVRDEIRYAVGENGDFVDRFELKDKLERSRAMLSATWAARSPAFGRSVRQPIPVRSDEELSYFLELTSPCSADSAWTMSQGEARDEMRHSLQHVTVTCSDSDDSVQFYFDAQ